MADVAAWYGPQMPSEERGGACPDDTRRPGGHRDHANPSPLSVSGCRRRQHVWLDTSCGQCLNLLVEKAVRPEAIRTLWLRNQVQNLHVRWGITQRTQGIRQSRPQPNRFRLYT